MAMANAMPPAPSPIATWNGSFPEMRGASAGSMPAQAKTAPAAVSGIRMVAAPPPWRSRPQNASGSRSVPSATSVAGAATGASLTA